MLKPPIDLSSLQANPAAWLTTMAGAISRGDDAGIRGCQARLIDLGWLVFTPADVERLRSAEAAAEPPGPEGQGAVEQQAEPDPSPSEEASS